MTPLIDRAEVAIGAGHGAAVNLLLAMVPAAELDIAGRWPSFGERLEEGREPVVELGRYICARPDAVAGETLFRKAAELGIHTRPLDGWLGMERADRLTYDLFAVVTRTVFDALAPIAPAEAGAPLRPPALEDTIFERIEGGGDRDEHRVAALETALIAEADAEAEQPPAPPAGDDDALRCFICGEPILAGQTVLDDVNEGTGHRACFGEDRESFVSFDKDGEPQPLGPDEPMPEGYLYEPEPAPPPPADAPAAPEPEPVASPEPAAAPDPAPAAEAPLSIGERPIDMAKQRPAKHGGRRTKKASQGNTGS